MSRISEDTILKLENLSKLHLTDDERHNIKCDLEKIVTMFDKLSEVDTIGVEPLSHITQSINVLRSDEVKGELSSDAALLNVSNSKKGYIAVPRFLKPK